MEKNEVSKLNAGMVGRYLFMHILPIGALFTDVTAFDWIVCVAMYVIRMFFITAGYHRYFSHRTFKTSRVMQFFFAFMAQTSIQKGALWWASTHRVHHRHSDTPEDPHSRKVYGFFHSHVGWFLNKDHNTTNYKLIQDFAKYKDLVWLNEHYLIPVIAMSAIIVLLGGFVNGGGTLEGLYTGGWSTLFIGYFLSTIFLYHGTYSINSLMHTVGKPRYKTGDNSKNNFILAILTLGEGWHNNHHYYQASTRQGFFWWEVDITYYVLRAMQAVGLVWDINEVPDKVKNSNLLSESA